MTGSVLLAVRRLVDGAGTDGPAWLRVRDGLVVERGTGEPPAPADRDLGTVVPGHLDMHVHGALGTDFGTLGADPGPAVEHHARAGSTTLVASVATAALDTTAARLRELVPVVRSGALAGVHLEGPWLSAARCGAHDPLLLRAPHPRDVAALLAAGDGTVRMVTLAPELPGAPAAVAELVAAGVTVALGHTDADADTVRRALDAGATVFTHLFNGMPPLHHRRPGPVGVALSDDRATVELIADGHHVADEALALARRAAPGRVALVSDAMAATGLGDGRYRLAGSDVLVESGVANLADGSSLAGSTATVADVVRRLRARGVGLPELVSASTRAPAAALGLAGDPLQIGRPADLVELRDEGPHRVMRRGRWLASSS
ncbi:N-acetylglucosamine-6-phosphate deacetylase [uncultured Modestobacter sp.]|uniref:N-acetylglucosamine-6-phosphate deacetylase n=1 Tax=uncultured Modestobacter sp. TaxID=380048 RepID=UPI0026288255|nr:amidohydrolase family protein [uncultured Modestobacter sp.]